MPSAAEQALCARTIPEAFFDTLSAFEKLPLPRGNRMGVFSITGMGCVAATDAAEEYGIVLPALSTATLHKLAEVIPFMGSGAQSHRHLVRHRAARLEKDLDPYRQVYAGAEGHRCPSDYSGAHAGKHV